jgi:lipopolysaccharide export system protein LptC
MSVNEAHRTGEWADEPVALNVDGGLHPAGDVSRAGLDYAPPERKGAFRAAGRHTARVRLLRWFMILGAAFAVTVISIAAIFDPFKHLPGKLSIAGVGVSGNKVTLDSPKISGLQQGGGLFDVAAKTGIQDVTTPNVIELVNVDAHVGMSDGTMTHVLSNHGVYDSKEDTMALDGDVRIANSSGYRFGLRNAMVNFKEGTLSSDERTRVDFDGGNVLADSVSIANNGHLITFQGHISSTFAPQTDDGPPAPTGGAELIIPAISPGGTQ